MLVCEVWIFIVGNIIAGSAKSLPQLVAGRMIAGVGGAGLLSLCIIVVSRKCIPYYVIRASELTRSLQS